MTENPPQKRRQRNTVLIKRVHDANQLTDPLETLSSFRTYKKDNSVYTFECKRVWDLELDIMKWILTLEETNMKVLYEGSEWGWNVKKKTDEMTHHMAWYLLAKNSEGSYVGFSHFRFDMDYGSVVLYCYELQLEERIRRVGLGRHIMTLLETIAYNNNMEKVILTVFKKNTSAIDFFTSLSYRKDETSPDEIDKDCFYCILSKPINNDTISEATELRNFIQHEIDSFKRISKDDVKMDTSDSPKEFVRFRRAESHKFLVNMGNNKITIKTEPIDEILIKTENEVSLDNVENMEILIRSDDRNIFETTINDKFFVRSEVAKALEKAESNALLKTEIDTDLVNTGDLANFGNYKDSESNNGLMEIDKSGDKIKMSGSNIGPMELDKTEGDGSLDKSKESVCENGAMELDSIEDDECLHNTVKDCSSSKIEEGRCISKIEEDRILDNSEDDGNLVKTKDGR